MQRPPPGPVADRRIADAIDRLERRRDPRSQYVTVDFGSTPTTAAQLDVGGMAWLTASHVVTVGLTTSAQAIAGLRGAATTIVPGRGFTLVLRSITNLSGPQRVGIVAV